MMHEFNSTVVFLIYLAPPLVARRETRMQHICMAAVGQERTSSLASQDTNVTLSQCNGRWNKGLAYDK